MATLSPTIQAQQDFYDKHWAGVTFANHLKLQRCVAILDALADLGLAEPRVLEVGCGTGWLTAILAQFGPATGVELSPRAVEEASRRYPHARFEHVDLSSWTPDAGGYDLVVSQEVIEHLEDQPAHLRLIHGLLRPGGYLILTTPNATAEKAREAPVAPEARAWTEQPIEYHLTVAELTQLVRQAGFAIRRETTLIPVQGRSGIRRFANAPKAVGLARALGLGPAYDHVRGALGFGLHTLVVAQKV